MKPAACPVCGCFAQFECSAPLCGMKPTPPSEYERDADKAFRKFLTPDGELDNSIERLEHARFIQGARWAITESSVVKRMASFIRECDCYCEDGKQCDACRLAAEYESARQGGARG